MNELTPNSNIKLDPTRAGGDTHALRDLVGMMNNPDITGAVVPPEVKEEIAAAFKIQSPTVPESVPTATSAIPPASVSTKPGASLGDRLFFTGRLGVGKDYVASAAGF